MMTKKEKEATIKAAKKVSSNMGNVSKKYRDKAPNDKSYFVTVLGINRKFVDSVPDNKQNEIKEKYHIPETIEEGENNYYTIQINGEYYCVQQEGSFSLYDKVMAYLPNGDLSRIYIDYQSGGKGDGATVVIYHTPYNVDPADEHEVNDGDYWIAVESAYSDKFKYFKQRIDGEWITYCSATNDLNITIERAIIVQESDII